MMNHFVIIVLLSSVGLKCPAAEPCTRLYMQGLFVTNYPQLAGVYVLQSASPVESWKDFPVYQHELYELFLYYNSSEAALMIGPHESDGLLRVEKKPGVDVSRDENYSMDHLFNFLSWSQWDPLHNKFVVITTNTVITPVCVDQNFGFCTSGILHPNISDTGSYLVSVLQPGDEQPVTELDVRKIHFELNLGVFHNLRPVYTLQSDIETIPYYLYHENGKWLVGAEIGSESGDGKIILEMDSDVIRVEYERQSYWYALGNNLLWGTAFRRLRCGREVLAGVNCEHDAGDVCSNGGSCHVDAAGHSSCICTPDFRGDRCQKPVARCRQTPSSSPSFAFSDREGSIASVFCSETRVLISICDGVQWWPHGWLGCEALPPGVSPLPVNTSFEDDDRPKFTRNILDGKIPYIIAGLVGLQLLLPFVCYCCVACCKYDENKMTSDEKPPAQQRLTKFVRACSGFFYFSWWLWLAYLMYYLCVWHGHVALDGTTVWSAVAIMAITCVCLLYVVILCESICSTEYEYLTTLKDVLQAEDLISRMKSECLSIKFKAACWHPETRTRTIHDGSGEDGNGMHTEMCTVHVPTADIEETFSYCDCVDVSGNFLLPTCNTAVTQVHIELDMKLADDLSQRMYDDAFQLFKRAHCGRDQQVDFSVEYDVPSYVRELYIRDPNKRWMSSGYFILATCLCLTWPYRWRLNSSKSDYHYRVVKKVTVSPTQHEPTVPTGLPILIDISNEEGLRSLAPMPSVAVPITPPPPYEE